jgi:hypothetical protein
MSQNATRRSTNTWPAAHTGETEAGEIARPVRTPVDTSTETSPAPELRAGRSDHTEGTAIVVDSSEANEAFELRDDDDDLDFDEFEEELLEGFAESPEAGALPFGIGWSPLVLEYGRDYHGITIATMTADQFEDIVFGVFPRKVSCEPTEARPIVEELRAFWTFLKRLGLEQAEACIRLLGANAVAKLERELSNPDNFGMAKSFFMAGRSAGFDMSSEAGTAAWMAAYNARIAGGPALGSPSASAAKAAARRGKKNKRKAQRAARRKNR